MTLVIDKQKGRNINDFKLEMSMKTYEKLKFKN